MEVSLQNKSFFDGSKKGCSSMKKAVIYARQSSGDEDQSASVDQQILNCKRLAADQDLQIIDVFSDLNISGKTYPDTTEALALAAVDEAYKSWVNSTYLKTHKYRKGLAQVLGVLKNVDYVLLDDFTRLMRPESLRLPKHRQSNIEINVDGLPDQQQKKNCQFAKRLFDQVVDSSLAPKTKLKFSVEKDKSKRSAYYGAKRGIKLTPGVPFETYLHEMGHWIEDCNPEVKNICKEFLSKRTKGEKPQKLNVLSPNSGYQDDEYTLKDNFSNPYCGKIYPDGGSEILSMGIQMLAENPTSFYRNDPEYFGLIVSILRNEFPKKKK